MNELDSDEEFRTIIPVVFDDAGHGICFLAITDRRVFRLTLSGLEQLPFTKLPVPEHKGVTH